MRVFDARGHEKKPQYLTDVDEVGSTTYIGKRLEGVATSDPLWQVQKLVSSGGDLATTSADGNLKYDNVWDDRLSLTYS